MNKVFEIFEQIQDTSSRNEKEAILLRNKDNEKLKTILEYTYNPFKIFGIGEKTFKNKVVPHRNSKFNDIIDLLDYLLINNTGTDEIKEEILAFISDKPEEYQDWYIRIILKDLKIGTTEKTINKIFKNLVPVFECMLASPYENKMPKNISVEPKLDGYRCLGFTTDGRLFTRNGKQIEGFKEIEEQVKMLPNGYVLDGELIATDFKGTQETVFKKSENKTGVNYNVFDLITYEDFKNGKSTNNLLERKEILSGLFTKFMLFSSNIKIVKPYYVGSAITSEVLNNIHDNALVDGYEGVMIKDLDSLYECKRTKTWLKKKNFDLLDLEVIDVLAGDGNFEGMLGAVVVEYKNSKVQVGSGFTEEERIRFFQNPNEIIGKTIMVQSQEESQDKLGKYSLRFPVFKGIQLDR